MVSVSSFVSRLLHIGGSSILLAHAWAPLWTSGNSVQILHPYLIPGISLLLLLTGLYDVLRAEPASFARRGDDYRALTYGKILLLFGFTETFERFAGKYAVAAVAFVLLLMSTNSKFVRESQTLIRNTE
jgi:hypothetical protein